MRMSQNFDFQSLRIIENFTESDAERTSNNHTESGYVYGEEPTQMYSYRGSDDDESRSTLLQSELKKIIDVEAVK